MAMSKLSMFSQIDGATPDLSTVDRLSLLSAKERIRQQYLPEKKSLIHRLVYIARLTGNLNDKRDLGAYYEQLFKKLHNHYQGEPATGLLLIYPQYCIHSVESSSEMLTATLRDLVSHQQSEGALLSDAKILIMSHDIPTRLYPQWSHRVLNLPASRLEKYETNESVEQLVPECLTQLLKLGVYLAKTPKLNLKNAMDSLHEKVPELLPPQDLIGYLLTSLELDSPQQYLKRYHTPFHTVLDGELVWPVADRLFPLK
ncbi:testis-expressed protein 47-like isoform X1 [Branchiostoma floridae]|uniref:Testis-expressed protein 47-like isoform X1 n=1 Tax=Branchiostoma floridae TaxID=7739 RepID=A0A9J7M707_BRAFL|nr:testis-expressed protein 47-like isoform X1 [Branchiostoma floridae]